MRVKFLVSAGLAIMAMCCVTILLSPTAMAKTIILKHADSLTSNHTLSQATIAMQQEIERRTNGRVKFQNFWAGSLLGSRDLFSGIQSGLADCGTWIPSYNPHLSQLMEGIIIGGGLLPGKIGSTIRAFNELYWGKSTEPIAALREYFNGKNVEILTLGTVGGQEIIANTALPDPTALKGLRTRGSSTLKANLDEYGATFVNMTWGEVYEALMRGVLDATYSYKFSIVNDKVWEYVQHTTWNLGACYELSWAWNKKKLDSLPEDIRKIILEVTFEQGPWLAKNLFDKVEARALDVATSHGMKVYPMTDENRAAWQKGYEKTIAHQVDVSKKAGYSDAEKYLERFFEEQRKWAPLYGEDE